MPNRSSQRVLPETIAAVDLGSNSFHMIVAKTVDAHFKVVDRMRETIRLAAGLDQNNWLTPPAMERALRCLERFGERVRHFAQGSVRVVGTNTLRKARNAPQFQQLAEAALGHPIDVISGHEEARLIYLGVSHGLEDEFDLRLVIDIGGGSTELILGRRFEPLYMESLHMGCVSMSDSFFGEGVIDAKRMRAAEIAARQELEPVEETIRRAGWQSAIGASGTNLAIRDIVMAQGWSQDGITKESLFKLRDAMIDLGHIDKLGTLGVSVDRRPVFTGGVAILLGAVEELNIKHMSVSDTALREGVLYDLLGRIQHEDVRDRTVAGLMDRYQVDKGQGNRVNATAQSFLQQVADSWSLNVEEVSQLLQWASCLHEIGQAISHSQYHKHGAYLLNNLDMPGFARGEQRRLAILIRGHRRKVPVGEFAALAEPVAQQLQKLLVLLRLAIVLHRRRGAAELPRMNLKAEDKSLKLGFPGNWLEAHPLTRADLEQEAGYLRIAGFKLKLK